MCWYTFYQTTKMHEETHIKNTTALFYAVDTFLERRA